MNIKNANTLIAINFISFPIFLFLTKFIIKLTTDIPNKIMLSSANNVKTSAKVIPTDNIITIFITKIAIHTHIFFCGLYPSCLIYLGSYLHSTVVLLKASLAR